MEAETGWGLQSLYSLPKDYHVPFFDTDEIKEVIGKVAKRGIEVQNWQPILDTVRELPCHEDFEPWDTNVRKDFLRKWYHTRTKIKMVSLEACIDDPTHSIHQMAADSSHIEEQVAAEDFVRRFKARLSPKDLEILELRAVGYTYEAIARAMGYKNHSGVAKRIRAITEAFKQYEDEQ